MSSFNRAAHRLEGSGSESGGLIIKSSKTKQDKSSSKDDHVFKKPTTSLLGLDRLARKKREEREAEISFTEKKPKLLSRGLQSEVHDSDPDVRLSFGKSSRLTDAVKERRYRGSLEETPSHTGGVSTEALQRIQSRQVGRDQKSLGVYASTAKFGDRDRPKDSVLR